MSKLLVITDGCRFCDSKQTDNNNKYITYVVGSHFSLGSTARPKVFVISRILADFSSLRDNSANPNISRIISSRPYFFQIAKLGSSFISLHEIEKIQDVDEGAIGQLPKKKLSVVIKAEGEVRS